ncbi:hypothetical protein [Mixta intestinalis]|uniref:Uncharacterized protein n=1 Tax=Mixta intestinalis TaxID=1615494 RepID=A0A6P1Q665_9GAMM|nr:hypothetical protein [Mixta intestinalis]QHM73902.1 hypothetical protein C7M51_04263 [Mixta intestinalis]
MKGRYKIFLLLFYVIGLVALCLLSVDKYSWMSEIDPSVVSGSIIDNSKNSKVINFLLFLVLMLSQLILFIFEKRRKWRTVSFLLVFIAIMVYALF